MHKYDKNLFKSFHVDFLPMFFSAVHFHLNLCNLIIFSMCVHVLYIITPNIAVILKYMFDTFTLCVFV